MTESQPNKLVRYASAIALTIGFPAGTALWRPEALPHSKLSLLVVLFVYEVLVVGMSVFLSVTSKLRERWLERVADRLDIWLGTIVTKQRTQYRKYVRELHTDVRTVGVATRGMFAIELQDIFVELALVATPAHAANTRIVTRLLSDRDEPRSRLNIWSLLDASRRQQGTQRLAVLGAPGSGKSTLLEHCALVLVSERNYRNRFTSEKRLPILLTLRNCVGDITAEPQIDLAELTRRNLPRRVQGPPDWFESGLTHGKFLVLLDGIDEVGEGIDRIQVVQWIESQASNYSSCQFVVTSRPYGYRDNPLEVAAVVQVLPLTQEQINTFAKHWFLSTEVRAAGRRDQVLEERAESLCCDFLDAVYRLPGLSELTVNPLLLTMAINVHYYRGVLPTSRTELYSEICEVLLGRRQVAKGLQQRLNQRQLQSALEKLAFAMMEKQVKVLVTSEMQDLLRGILANFELDDYEGVNQFLSIMDEETGLLQELNPGYWGFSHLTFQEYLASRYLVETPAARFDWTAWWRETIVFWSTVSDVSRVVDSCLDYAGGLNPLKFSLMELALEQSREVSPDTRARFQKALETATESDATVMLQVVIRRSWSVTWRASSGADVRSIPMTGQEYALYTSASIASSTATGEMATHSRPISIETSGGISCIAGVSGADALDAVQWMQSGLLNEWNLRLPTIDEARRFPAHILDELSIWATPNVVGSDVRLFGIGGVKQVTGDATKLRQEVQADLVRLLSYTQSVTIPQFDSIETLVDPPDVHSVIEALRRDDDRRALRQKSELETQARQSSEVSLLGLNADAFASALVSSIATSACALDLNAMFGNFAAGRLWPDNLDASWRVNMVERNARGIFRLSVSDAFLVAGDKPSADTDLEFSRFSARSALLAICLEEFEHVIAYGLERGENSLAPRAITMLWHLYHFERRQLGLETPWETVMFVRDTSWL